MGPIPGISGVMGPLYQVVFFYPSLTMYFRSFIGGSISIYIHRVFRVFAHLFSAKLPNRHRFQVLILPLDSCPAMPELIHSTINDMPGLRPAVSALGRQREGGWVVFLIVLVGRGGKKEGHPCKNYDVDWQ